MLGHHVRNAHRAAVRANSLLIVSASGPSAQPLRALDREGGAGREPRPLLNFSLTLKRLPMPNGIKVI